MQAVFGMVSVDGYAPVVQEEVESDPTVQTREEGLGQIAIARNAQELLFGQGKQCVGRGMLSFLHAA